EQDAEYTSDADTRHADGPITAGFLEAREEPLVVAKPRANRLGAAPNKCAKLVASERGAAGKLLGRKYDERRADPDDVELSAPRQTFGGTARRQILAHSRNQQDQVRSVARLLVDLAL